MMSVYFGKCSDAFRRSWSQAHCTDIHVKSCDPFSGLMVLSGTYCTQADRHRSTRMLLLLKNEVPQRIFHLGPHDGRIKPRNQPDYHTIYLTYYQFCLLKPCILGAFCPELQKINCMHISLILVVILFLLEPIAKIWSLGTVTLM